MADYKVKKTEVPVCAMVEVPGSKSITNRALLISALSEGESTLSRVLFSDDSRVFIKALQELGVRLYVDEISKQVIVVGRPEQLLEYPSTEIWCSVSAEGHAEPAKAYPEPVEGHAPASSRSIYVGSAGTAARFLTALLALSEGEYFIDASEQMKKRPMQPLFEALAQMGAEFTFTEEEGFLPVNVKGAFYGGRKLLSDAAVVDSDKSTQFLSALLMIAPLLANRVGKTFSITVTGSRAGGSYVKMTEKVMRDFGIEGLSCKVKQSDDDENVFCIAPNNSYTACNYEIEPDLSAACYFYAVAALTGGEVIVKGVHSDSCQGDIKFLDVLVQMGCTREETEDGIKITGPKGGKLKGISVNMKDFSDQTMTLAAIAPFCEEPVEITGIGHIRGQESDRISAIAVELTRMGIRVEEGESSLKIYPGIPKQAEIKTYNDHRIAMAFAITGLRCEGIIIKDCECCKKTFEEYFDLFDDITGNINTRK